MLAALATAAFLATFWMLGMIALQTFSDRGSKIVAALKGRSVLAAPAVDARIAWRVSQRPCQQPALRVQPQWRAAA